MSLAAGPLGLYIHVPYCSHRCPYCDFYLTVGRPDERFVARVLEELSGQLTRVGAPRALQTIYLGGGTPSRLAPRDMARLMEGIRAQVELAAAAEVTVEANPLDATLVNLTHWKGLGVTRISLGVQSTDDAVLRRLGRDHDGAEARAAMERVATAEFATFTVDLIFGTPGQDRSSLQRDLAVVTAAPHVSVYGLTYEPGTHLFKQVQKGRLQQLSDDEEATLYATVQAAMQRAGYRQYEVSSYAKAGHASVHNRLYWGGGHSLGLGPSAVSYLRLAQGGARRWRRRSDLGAYLDGRLDEDDVEELNPQQAAHDRLFCGIRDLEQGVDLDVIERQHGVKRLHEAEKVFRHEVDQGAVERHGERAYRLTPQGALFADRVARALLYAGDSEG